MLVYYFEGRHDASIIIIEVDLARGWKDLELYKVHKANWHIQDSYVFALFHLLFGAASFYYFYEKLTYPLIETIVQSVTLLFVALMVRWIVHDAIIYKYWRGTFNHVPSCDGAWDWLDCLIKKLNDKGINQYVLKFAILGITIALYFFSLNILGWF